MITPHRTPILLVATCVLLLSASTQAARAGGNARESGAITPRDEALMATEGMLGAHPDLRWRREGLREIEAGRIDKGVILLRRAARFADKSAQAMLAELLWNGDGIARDRAEAYAWMDLAAERGYPLFTVHREKYWAALDQRERARALEVGAGIYAEYGDDVAKPRLEQHLEDRLRRRSGSRLGGHGVVRVHTAPRSNPSGGAGILGIKRGPDSANGTFVIYYAGMELPGYYDDKYWNPKDYWQWQDEIHDRLPTGIVTVGEMASEAE